MFIFWPLCLLFWNLSCCKRHSVSQRPHLFHLLLLIFGKMVARVHAGAQHCLVTGRFWGLTAPLHCDFLLTNTQMMYLASLLCFTQLPLVCADACSLQTCKNMSIMTTCAGVSPVSCLTQTWWFNFLPGSQAAQQQLLLDLNGQSSKRKTRRATAANKTDISED